MKRTKLILLGGICVAFLMYPPFMGSSNPGTAARIIKLPKAVSELVKANERLEKSIDTLVKTRTILNQIHAVNKSSTKLDK